MKPEEQRIAIAEALNWRWWSYYDGSGTEFHFLHSPHYTEEMGKRQQGKIIDRPDDYLRFSGDTPDYLKDLNACHEMEKALSSRQWAAYEYTLEDLSGATVEGVRNLLHATAAQRAEAFLRAIGKWTE